MENTNLFDNFLNNFVQTTDYPTLDAMYYLMNKLDNPHKKLKFVHVAGTNGKGSIVEMLNSCILASKKYTIGKFISPHLCFSNESIQINNEYIEEKSIQKYIPIFKNLENEYFKETNRHLTRFEVLTSIAILYFYEKKCDIAILEVGLGGLYDCTNIVNPIVSAFGSISIDHTAILGNTIQEIAKQKAGIIKYNSNTVIFEQEAIPTIKEKCKKENNDLLIISSHDISNYYIDSNQYFTYKNESYTVNLKGKKQIENACVVIEIINILNKEGFDINTNHVKIGLCNVTHHARFEKIYSSPTIIYDGAHNENAIQNLINSINTYYSTENINFVISIIRTKDYKKILNMLLSSFKNCTFTFTSGSSKEHNFFEATELYNFAKSLTSNNKLICEENYEIAVKNILKKNITTFIIGSFYNYKNTINILKQ